MMHVDATLLSPGKTLTDPLLLLLAAALIFLAITWRRARGHRAPIAYAIASLLLLAVLATDATTRALESTLIPRQPPTANRQPEVIVVPSGGSARGLSPEYDLLNESSHTRVVAAALWWRHNRTARIILTGADQTPTGPSTRTLELMRDTALRLGVPASAITIDAQSFNTLEHALRIAALPGITRTTPLGLVTSAWHMRRARGAFARRFTTVIPYPVPDTPAPLILNDFLPSSAALRNTTRLLHEWLGIAWYALRR